MDVETYPDNQGHLGSRSGICLSINDEIVWQLPHTFDPSMLPECLKFDHSSSVERAFRVRQPVAESG